jgi:hypothetical protein
MATLLLDDIQATFINMSAAKPGDPLIYTGTTIEPDPQKYSTYKTNQDDYSIFKTTEIKRADGTLFKRSVLSGGTAPRYGTRTITWYDAAGTTVTRTVVYTLNYTDGILTSEVAN